MADKDRPSTWRPYVPSLCQSCRASCCTMPVEIKAEDLVRLGLVNRDEIEKSKKKVFKKLKAKGIVASYREATDLFMLQSRPSGDCMFLHPITRLCQVYDRRPETCRKFPEVGPRPGFCPYHRKTES